MCGGGGCEVSFAAELLNSVISRSITTSTQSINFHPEDSPDNLSNANPIPDKWLKRMFWRARPQMVRKIRVKMAKKIRRN